MQTFHVKHYSTNNLKSKFLQIPDNNEAYECRKIEIKVKSAPNYTSRASRSFSLNLNLIDVTFAVDIPHEKENNIKKIKKENPFYKKQTLTILTETSELSEFINPNFFFFTPKDSTISMSNKRNSFFLKSTAGLSSKSNSINFRSKNMGQGQYELSLTSDRSTYSKSTLKRAEEFLECLRTREANDESPQNITITNPDNPQNANDTLGGYLITDQIQNEIEPTNKWIKESQINHTCSFNINADIQKNKHTSTITKLFSLPNLKILLVAFLILISLLFVLSEKEKYETRIKTKSININKNNNLLSLPNKYPSLKENNLVFHSLPKYELIFHKRLKELELLK